MKRTLLSLSLLLNILSCYAQDGLILLHPQTDSCFWWPERGGLRDPMNEYSPQTPTTTPPSSALRLSPGQTLHFLSPQPIQYVDISSGSIEGDLPLKTLLRIKIKENAVFNNAIVTIAGEDFIAQYPIAANGTKVAGFVEIQPADTRPLDISGIGFSHPQLRKMAYNLFCNTPSAKETVKAFGIKASLNHIYTAGDYLFLDVSYKNNTNLSYNIDDFRFSLDDKNVAKATNVQSVVIKPELALFDVPQFDKFYRNIFVLKKMSYPGSKVLTIGMSEKQISGRIINLTIPYKDVLQADTINF